MCGHHAAQTHPDDYPKGSAPRKGGGRYGNQDTYHLAFNEVVPERVRKKSKIIIIKCTKIVEKNQEYGLLYKYCKEHQGFHLE